MLKFKVPDIFSENNQFLCILCIDLSTVQSRDFVDMARTEF